MSHLKSIATSLVICASGFGLFACSPAEEPASVSVPSIPVQESIEPSNSPEQQNQDVRLNAYFEEIFNREVNKSPEFQTQLGLKTDRQGEWDDTSDAYAELQLQESKDDLAYLEENFDYEQLSDDVKVSYDLFKYGLDASIRGAEFNRHSYVVDQFRGQFTSPLSLLQNAHTITNLQDAQDYITRVNGIEGLMNQMVVRVQDRATFGVIPPAFSFPAMLTDISKIMTGAPIDQSQTDHPLYADFKGKVTELDLTDNQKDELISQLADAIKGPFLSGYTALFNEVTRLQPLQDKDVGVWALPDGEAFYNYRIQSNTTLDLNAEQIHQIGLDDVARIHGEMRSIMDEVGFTGTLQEFFAFVRTDPNNFYADSDAGREQFLADAREQTAEIFEVAGDYFHRLPKAELEVRKVEAWRENSTSIAFYNRPSQDGSRPGIYYANLADMTGVQKYVFKAITYHEGVPGHHFQIALAQEFEDLPKFRKFSGYTAFTEGWALYAEKLALEMGFYKDPMHNFGRLQDEIWRSVRLVTDTGIHAKRWTRQQAIDYFLENTPISEQDIVTEVERYFVLPGQALSYKMGMIKILEYRAQAQTELGELFDIRDFHDAVIGAGSLPLPALKRRVESYIAKKKS